MARHALQLVPPVLVKPSGGESPWEAELSSGRDHTFCILVSVPLAASGSDQTLYFVAVLQASHTAYCVAGFAHATRERNQSYVTDTARAPRWDPHPLGPIPAEPWTRSH